MDQAPPRFSYDEVPYPGGAFDQTHPDRLATLAALFGLTAPPLASCRVLELGCGNGSNLVPMALDLPGATFFGVDLSARHIEQGNRWIERLGLGNIRLAHGDILELAPEVGSYDYILAHGVFSWVPPVVQEKILDICATALAPNGIAYISYNTYPGWHTRAILRDVMRFHTQELREPTRRVAQARAVASFVADSIPAHNPLYTSLIRGELGRLMKLADEYLLHDDLSEVNLPLYFHEFVGRAAQHGLKYLAEALFSDMRDDVYPERAREMLRQARDIVTYEQYLDFLSCRSFRQTLLCRSAAPVDRRLTPDRVRGFYAASDAGPVSAEPDITGSGLEKFTTPRGVTLSIDAPVAKAALAHLASFFPRSASFDELLAAVRARLGRAGDELLAEDDAELGELLLGAYSGNAVELHVHRPKFADAPGERPLASPLARMQAEEGSGVTSLTFQNIVLDDAFARHLLPYLDGRNDRAALIEQLTTLALEGRLGAPASADAEAARAFVAERIEPALAKMARYALLLA